MAREIQLTQGRKVIVDSEDYELLVARGNWCFGAKGYAARNERRADGKWRAVLMHRLIMQAPEGLQVDHIDGNRLNNRRSNLRLCTPVENNRNRGPNVSNPLGIKGVYWIPRQRKYRASIRIQGQTKQLGVYDDPLEASRVFDAATLEHRGEFARPNGVEWISPLKIASIQFPVPIPPVPGLIIGD
ncbi:HNH endonuclease [Botrimarina mediterranea]|uniref:AP2 domain protein n=1 Tax=Botrimarina mediterranea TaxID=2528022 RepID=A0A518K3W7_9BACT|nr:AP2 domain protein [Botrimarina mediterranea]QDV77039.1 AP2 domain protein [Planctomycetes bacterium K2D]